MANIDSGKSSEVVPLAKVGSSDWRDEIYRELIEELSRDDLWREQQTSKVPAKTLKPGLAGRLAVAALVVSASVFGLSWVYADQHGSRFERIHATSVALSEIPSRRDGPGGK